MWVVWKVFCNGIQVMVYEMICDLMYPIPESLTAGYCSFFIQLAQLFIQGAPIFIGIGQKYIRYMTIVNIILSLIISLT